MEKGKLYRNLTLVGLLILLAIGCRKNAKETMSVGENVELIFMYPETGGEEKPLLAIMEAYQKQNPLVTLERINIKSEDSATVLPLQFSAGKTPADIVSTTFSWFIKEQAAKGHITDLTSSIDQNDFLAGAFKSVSVDGKIYGGPFSGGITSLEYRKSFFRKNNLPDPNTLTTWGDFTAMLEQANQIDGVEGAIGTGGGIGWPLTSIIESFVLTFGGVLMHDQLTAGTLSWQEPAVKEIFMTKLLPLIKNGSFGAPDEFSAVLQAMWSGKHALFWGDSTDSANVSPPEDRGVALLPGQKGVIFWKSYFFIPAYTEHPTEAIDFMKYLLTDGQSMSVSKGGRIASYKNIDSSQYPPPEQEVIELIKNSTVTDDMDDTVGGRFQAAMWEQWFLVWSDPTEATLDRVLAELDQAHKSTTQKN